MMLSGLRHRIRQLWRAQAGTTLAEIVIAVGIMSVVLPTVGSQLFSALSIGQAWQNDIGATVTLRQASNYVMRDAVSAQAISLGVASAPADTVTLTWQDTSAVDHTVVYALSGSKLIRTLDSVSLAVARDVNSVVFSRSSDLLTFVLVVDGASGTTDTVTAQSALPRVP